MIKWVRYVIEEVTVSAFVRDTISGIEVKRDFRRETGSSSKERLEVMKVSEPMDSPMTVMNFFCEK